LRAIAGDEAEFTLIGYDPYPGDYDMGLYKTLAAIIREADPDGVPLPYIQPAVTDARHFRRLGIQNYGFTPLNLPANFDFLATLHAPDERVPVDALEFGANALYELLRRDW
jgi:acetylornithine deacetylase/succinyl-diaminopimelate desuccinylase-like protein